MLHIYYKLTIYLEDKDDINIYVSKELRDFFITHERYEDDFLPDDYYNDDFFSIDISEEDINKLEELCKSPEEKQLLNNIKELNISYLNIEPHTIIGY